MDYTTSNFELNQIAQTNSIALGINNIIMKDQITNSDTNTWIINLESSNKQGTHWVAMIKFSNIYFFFDSYGAIPPTSIIKYVKSEAGIVAYNNYIIQSLDSTMCGFFCLTFLHFMQNAKNTNKFTAFNNYINIFEPDNNDETLKDYIRRNFI